MSDAVARLNAALDGRYTIERQLGEGGMATVYLADDLKHERKVAFKVLKPELAAVLGAERFLAEIKTTANLQHPHILPLFDSGEAESFLYYVMPHVEGESLRERLDREHQLPVDEAVRIATNMAEALDYSHRQGVIHRDIKPGNVLIHDGQPVITDFGIALAVGGAGGGRLTETGLSLGTPHYMSPEQAAGGQHLGPATDIYALGCVLYEMLVGEPPFTGSTPQAILGKIIAGERVSAVGQRDTVPTNVDAAIAKALEKLPADRFSSAARFAQALGDPSFMTSEPTPAVMSTFRAQGLGRVAWHAVTVVAIGLALWGWMRPQPRQPVIRTQISLPEDQRVLVRFRGSHPLAISRDGTRLVYVGERAGVGSLFLRELDDLTPQVLGGTNDARQPFFSPDAEWVDFFASGQLQRVRVSGGAPITITPLPPGETRGASWGADNTILFAAGPGLYRVPMAGGDPVPFGLSQIDRTGRAGADSTAQSGNPRWPHHLPGGEHALVGVFGGTGVLDLGTGEVRFLFDGTQARYVPTGHLLFHAGGERIRAVPFDLDRLDVNGAEVPVLEGVFRGQGAGAAVFAVSETGTLAYVTGGFDRSLWLVERDGREERIPVEARGYRWPRVSPDGNRVAVIVDPRPSDVWMVDLQRGSAEPLTTAGHHVNPGWAPDGERLGFTCCGGDLHWIRWREGGEPRLAAARPLPQYQPSWSIDDHIMVNEIHPENRSDLAIINLVDGSSAPFLATPASESAPNFSPDGRWVAYTSDVSGAREVYVRPFPGPGPRHSVSVGGGADAKWSKDGREIFYRSGTSILAVEVSTSPTFSSGPPRELFDASGYDFAQSLNWDVGPDVRFVMVKGDPSMLRQLQIVQNFFEELREVGPN